MKMMKWKIMTIVEIGAKIDTVDEVGVENYEDNMEDENDKVEFKEEGDNEMVN